MSQSMRVLILSFQIFAEQIDKGQRHWKLFKAELADGFMLQYLMILK